MQTKTFLDFGHSLGANFYKDHVSKPAIVKQFNSARKKHVVYWQTRGLGMAIKPSDTLERNTWTALNLVGNATFNQSYYIICR